MTQLDEIQCTQFREKSRKFISLTFEKVFITEKNKGWAMPCRLKTLEDFHIVEGEVMFYCIPGWFPGGKTLAWDV